LPAKSEAIRAAASWGDDREPVTAASFKASRAAEFQTKYQSL
jgi:hypothetical protein